MILVNNKNMNNIVITGSSGTIVKSIINELCNLEEIKDYNFLCLSSSSNSINVVSNKNNFNYSNSIELNKVLNEKTILIHFAAVTRSDKVQSKYTLNETITSFLIAASQKKNIKKFIYISSDLAGLSKGPYGVSKENCEKIVKDSKIKYTILRLSPFIAKGQFSENSTIIKLLKKAKKKSTFLILPSGGNIEIKFIFWMDLINVLYDCIINQKTLK